MAVKTRSTIKSDITSTLETGGLNRISEIRQVSEDIVDSAVFPADLATVATTGSYNDLSDTPAGGSVTVDDTAFAASWDAVTDEAPSKNAVYDKITAMDTTISGKAATTTTISAGTGLTGGGSLASNRTISLNAASIASLALADSAIQSADLATVATTGSFTDLSDSPVSTAAYGIGWSGSGDVPTQGVLYTKFEALSYNDLQDLPTIPTVSDDAYGSGWNADTDAASKNAIYDKIEALDAAKSDTGHTHTKSDITDIGVIEIVTVSSSRALQLSDVGKVLRVTADATLTVNSGIFSAGHVVSIRVAGAAVTATIADGTATVTQVSGYGKTISTDGAQATLHFVSDSAADLNGGLDAL